MNTTYEIVYENQSDKIIMCDMSEKGHYCYATLKCPLPKVENENSTISTDELR